MTLGIQERRNPLVWMVPLLAAVLAVVFAFKAVPEWITKRVNERVARVWQTPLDTGKRNDWASLIVTKKGGFLADRPAYRNLQTHVHTGVDLQNRKRGSGPGETIYAVAKGKVHDVRIQAQGTRVTIEHLLPTGQVVYTSYIHVGGVQVKKGDRVDSGTPIARRFNKDELKKYGSIFNHLHYQVHKDRFVAEDTVRLTSIEQTREKFYDPKEIFLDHGQTADVDWRAWLREKRISFWRLISILF